MTEDELQRLLQQADGDAGAPPGPPADLADRLHLTARQRRRTRTAVRSTAVVLLLVIGVTLVARWRWVSGDDPARETITARVDTQDRQIAELRAEIERLRQEAEQRALTVRLLEANLKRRQSLANLRRLGTRPDLLLSIDQQVERAALTVLYQTDQLCNEPNQAESVVEHYRQIIDLFGQTQAADQARQRLSGIQKTKGGVL